MAIALALLPDAALGLTQKCIITIRKADPALGQDTLYDLVSLAPNSDLTFGKIPASMTEVTFGVDEKCQARLVRGDLSRPYEYKGMQNPLYGLDGPDFVKKLQAWRRKPENSINFSLW
ncbi:uncharacterized protein PgNI_07818 [Pyricularia grisea]|uniref:Uncharacterized protein n=1 Tax=Pyricularia grisea TaxID=148305 RepID=A0A6P8B0B6_PYRGI|nr:uncharacterized protein PgNI_07818 [Pyricularia grisea]TLD08360.1 hypothetical protein PgNI_07818 [Pyricularia grisea]